MSTDTRPGAALARRRWDRPEVVDRRVDALAATIRAGVAKLPPLSVEQRRRLADAIKAAA